MIGLFMGREVAWIVGDLHCRIRSGVTAAKAIETLQARPGARIALESFLIAG